MLLEKSQKLIELSQQKIKTKQYLDNKEGFKARNQQITQLLEQVNELVESLRLFRKHELIAIDSDPNIKNV